MDTIDRRSFILGMTTAFCECVAGECKRAAFTPPCTWQDAALVKEDVEKIITEQGCLYYFESNPELPQENRICWWVIAKFEDVLTGYLALRSRGLNACWDFPAFAPYLGYHLAFGEGMDEVKPSLREKKPAVDTVGRILFPEGGWPPAKPEVE